MTQLQNLLQALHHQNIPPDTLLYAEVISGGKFPSFAPLNWEDVMEHIVDIVNSDSNESFGIPLDQVDPNSIIQAVKAAAEILLTIDGIRDGHQYEGDVSRFLAQSAIQKVAMEYDIEPVQGFDKIAECNINLICDINPEAENVASDDDLVSARVSGGALKAALIEACKKAIWDEFDNQCDPILDPVAVLEHPDLPVFLFEQARLFIEQQGQQYLAQRAIEYAIGQARKAKPEWSRFVYQDIE
jgi:hypothetical protein